MKSVLRVYLDFKSPAAYLAFHPTLALIERTGAAVEWRPFRTQQRPIPEAKPDETRGETHRRVRAIQRRETHLKYAALRGLEMRFRNEAGDTDPALAVLLTDLVDPPAYIDAAFRAYWVDGVDLGDADTVADVMARSGHDPDRINWAAAAETLDAAQTEAEEAGVVDAPGYRIADQLFIGREHLPWISELLAA
ncbi:MAG: DsbA family protein [Pseudomonadota bacterium]